MHDAGTYVMLHEPKLFRCYLRICDKGSIVADKCFEFTTQRVALDPVDHEATIASAGSHAVVGVDEVKVVTDIFPALD